MIVAKWARGFEGLHNGADAQLVANEIMSIGEDATPAQIVDKGRDERTELHKCFTWDDADAAERWRKQEARMIVCHLMIRREDEEQTDDAPEVRFFLKAKSGEGYKAMPVILQREDEYTAMLRRALGELNAFQRKYTALSDRDELLALIGAVDAMLQSA